MSRIFVSYSREDSARAQALAKALERAGHAVWWDRHIHGGSRFAEEIKQALNDAEVVVVLWSSSSIESPWVQDEAAEGRDTCRLVPVLIDNSKPPLGFRQYQSIDLSGWNGRRKLSEPLLAAIHSMAQTPPADPKGATPLGEQRTRRPRIRAAAALMSLFVAAALLFVGWSYFWPRAASAETPTVAVLPFADLSQAGDKAYFAEGVAESILSLLGREPGIRVVGRTSASMFKSGETDLAAIRNALEVTHVLEGSARTSGDELRMSVRLIKASDGTQLWAEDYQRKLSNVFEVQDEIGRAVATRLAGTLSSGVKQTQTTRADAYDLYLAARAKMRDRKEPALREALALSKRVLAADPDYAPGHALYAELIWLLSDAPYSYGSIPQDKARTVALAHARKAISLAPKSSDGYAALGLVLPDEQAIQPLKRAIELDPARSEVRVWLSLAYEALGRNDESLRELEAAASIDPLWTVPINRLNNVLAASGRFDDARRVAQTYLERGGERAQAARFRSVIARYSADLSEAVRLATTARRLDPDVPYLKASLEADAAILNLPQLVSWEPGNRLFSWLNAKGNDDRLLAEARRAGTALWRRPDRTIAIRALAASRNWQHLEVLFDAAASADVQVCTGRVEVILAGAQALHHQGRTEEAARLLRCAQQQIAAHTRGRTRSDALDRASIHFNRAQILALLGEREAAIRALEEAVHYGWRGYPYSAKLASYPALDALRPTAKYSQIQRLLSQAVAAEQQQVLRDLNNRRRPDTL